MSNNKEKDFIAIKKEKTSEKAKSMKNKAKDVSHNAEEKIKSSSKSLKKDAKSSATEMEKNVESKIDKSKERGIEMREQFEATLNDIIGSLKSKHEEWGKAVSEYAKNIKMPLTDIVETNDEFIIISDIPNVEKENLDINVTEDSVIISAEVTKTEDYEDSDYIQRERNSEKIKREIFLPAKVKIKESKAVYEGSTLTITLKKKKSNYHKVKLD